jgi:hypothetical protein
MADIFGSSNNVPRWLEEDARPLDGAKLGAAVNTSLADLYTSLQKNPEAPADASWGDSRKGLAQAIFERNAATQDPLWKEHLNIQQGRYLLDQKSKWLQMDHTKKQMEVMDAGLNAKKKVEADEADDNQEIAGVVSRVGTNPQDILNAPMPVLKSVKGRLNWQAMVTTAKASQDHLDAVNEGIKNRQSDVNAAKEFNQRLRSLDTSIPEVAKFYALIKQEKDTAKQYDLLAAAETQQAQIQGQRNKDAGLEATKTTTGPTGTRTTYAAPKKTNLQQMQDYRDTIDQSIEPEKWAEADKVVQKLTVNPLDVVAAREANTMRNMAQRQQDKLAIMGQAQQFKLDFAKTQQDAKAQVAGKQISEQQFIGAHLNKTMDNVQKNWDTDSQGPITTQKVMGEATTFLKRAYRWTNPQKAVSNVPQAATAPDSGTNAAPATTAATKKLIYDPDSDTFK